MLGRALTPAALLLAALILSSGTVVIGGNPSGAAIPGSRAAGPSVAAAITPALPAPLTTSWSARSGYVPDLSSVTSVAPVTSPVTARLTLWPTDLGLFARPAAAPPLNAVQFADRYSPSNASYSALEGYFEGQGLAIAGTSSDRLSLSVSGPASAVGRAFGTTIEMGRQNGSVVTFPTSVPVLPPPYSSMVSAVSGLSTGFDRFTLPFSPATYRAALGSVTPAQGRTAPLITPTAIHTIYDMNSLFNYSGSPHWATGQGIALVLWGFGFSPADVSSFFQQFYPSEFPQPQIVPVPVDGAPAPSSNAVSDPSQAPLELTLDLEWSGSQAPGATLYAVYAPDGPQLDQYSPTDASLEDALNTAIQEPNVHVVSMSFATANGADSSFEAAFSTSFATAQMMGITVVAASGDNGGTNNAKGACTTTPQPQFPAASPLVLAVGGSDPVLSVTLTGAVTGLESESAWSGSGGGFSVNFPAPTYQTQSGAGSVIGSKNRGLPDVAGPAAFNFLYYGGKSGAGNGTSFAAPMWAGMIAMMNAIRGAPLGFINPRIYAIGTAQPQGTVAPGLADITTGTNCLGPATVGWDTATGWGSPRAGALYNDLTGSYVSVSLVPSTSSSAPGQSFDAHIVVLNATSHAPVPGLVVNLTLNSASTYAGPCGGILSTSNTTTDANGTGSASVSVPDCFLGTDATLTASVQSRGLFGSNSTSISVNLLGFSGFLAVITHYPYNVSAFAVIMAIATAVGWGIGSYRRRRRQAAIFASVSQTAPAAARPPGAPPQPPAPGSVPPRPGAAGTAAAATTAVAGAPASRPMVTCPVCGFRAFPDLGFCPRCGHYLSGPASPPPAPPPGPPPAH